MGRRRRTLKGAPKPPETWDAKSARNLGRRRRPNFSVFSVTAAEGAVPPEGERNPAEGGYFASKDMYSYGYVFLWDIAMLNFCKAVWNHINYHYFVFI